MSSIQAFVASLLFAFICGCASVSTSQMPTEIPPPLSSHTSAPAPLIPPPPPAPALISIPPEMKGEVYPLWYATNRMPNDRRDESKGYSTQSDYRVHYGKVFVEIPDDFLQSLRSENWLKRLIFKTAETKLKVRNRVPLSLVDFIADVKDEMGKQSSDERIALIYLHGFQTSFDEAAQRAASIGYQLKIPMTAFFSWPSRGAVAGYEADKNSVDASTDQLASFLIKFARESGATRVHLIAHSMGNYALLQTMFRPIMQQAIGCGLRFGQIILAAPDVDSRVFMRDAHLFTQVADRVTLYASSRDIALISSRTLADFPRAGLLPPPMVIPDIDTLDVSSVNLTLLGHSYVADEIPVLEDMNKLIFHNNPPNKRTRIRSAGNGTYWVLE